MARYDITHYALLGVPHRASAEQIQRAYREKMKTSHPDQFAGKLAAAEASGDAVQIRTARRAIARAEERAKRLNMAYDILSDPAKRRRYDIDLYMHQRMRSAPIYSAPRRPSPYARASSTGQTRASSAGPQSRASSAGPQSRASSAGPQSRASSTGPRSRASSAGQPSRRRWEARPSMGVAIGLLVIVTLMRMAAFGFEGAHNTARPDTAPRIIATFNPGQLNNATVDAILAAMPESSADTAGSGYFTARESGGRIIISTIEPAIISPGPDATAATLFAETYYERGLDYLAQSSEPRDEAEQMAIASFMLATLNDGEYRLAYRMLGEIYYDRWRAGGSAGDRQYALTNLTRYDGLTDGPLDSDVRKMLRLLE